MKKVLFLSARHTPPQYRRSTPGFSIPQFLIYSVTSTLLIMVTAATLISSIRSNKNMELYQRAEERWSRISSLIQSETSEADSIKYGEWVACLGYGGNVPVQYVFMLNIPNSNSSNSSSSIFYFLDNNTTNSHSPQLLRCGLGYNADGTLRIGQSLTLSTLGLRTNLVITNQAPDSFTFTLNFYSPSNQLILSRSATATVGVEPAQICNADGTDCAN
jgi:hypothetical protein